MGESYVRPVTGASEPRSETWALWRFRIVAFVLLVAVGVAFAWGINKAMHLGEQDPTSGVEAPEDPGISGP